jgi:dTDP-4-dehydrorhamnose 3,5-epimerase
MDEEAQRMVQSRNVGIDGVALFQLAAHEDDRGSFTEVYRHEWLSGTKEMVQCNLSRSRRNVLRGLHMHRKQADYWCFVSGTAFVGLFDLRDGSSTMSAKAEIRMSPDDGELLGLYIPPGVAHGFYAETDVALQYLVDQYFTGEDEYGLAWDDPDVAMSWPADRPILSERDTKNPPLLDAMRDAPAYGARSSS